MATAKFSKYKISWLIIEPANGRATQVDLKVCSKVGLFSITGKCITSHFPTAERAKQELQKLRSVSSKFSKRYRAFIISDAQFGEAKGFDFWNVATTKQKQEAITL